MTETELKADEFLICAKENVKGAITRLHANAKEPVSTAMLHALDSIDVARKALKNRGPK